MRRLPSVLTIALAILFSVLAAKAQTQPQAQAQEARDVFVRAYRVGPGDLLELKVFQVDELSQTVRVSEDGSITLPLLGRIVVEGLTQEGVVQKLTGLLQAKYVKNPQVTIFIFNLSNNSVPL